MAIEPTAPDGQNGYYLTKPIVTLTSTDRESYPADVMYRLNDTGYVSYAEPFVLPEGFVSMSWYSEDNHGYREDDNIATFNVDSDAPVTSLSVEGNEHLTGYFNSDSVEISLEAVDAVSGVEGIYYNLDGADGEYSSPIVLGNSGEYTLTYWAEDNAGNREEPHTYDIVIDRINPKAKLEREIRPGIGILTITASDKLAGIDKIYYAFNSGSWQEYTGPVALPEGRYQIDYYTVDKAGNESRIYYRNIRVPEGDDNGLLNLNMGGNEPLNTPDTDITLSCSSAGAMENIIWYAEIESSDAVEIGRGQDFLWTVPYTEDTMLVRIIVGANLIDEGMTVYASKTMLIENKTSADWNSLDRDDYYAGRTLDFDPVIYDAHGSALAPELVNWSLTINDGEPRSLDITTGIWTIPTEPGRMVITASYPETRNVTGEKRKEGFVIDIDNITDAYVIGIKGEEEPWYRSGVKVMLYPSGRAVRIEDIKYSINGAAEESFDNLIQLEQQGSYELLWYGIMPDGTEETPHSLRVAVDYQAPESEIGITMINGEEYLVLSAEDNLSGLKRIEYRLPVDSQIILNKIA